jgi:hypothetical protein
VDENPESNSFTDAEANADHTHNADHDQPHEEAHQPTVELHPFLTGSCCLMFFPSLSLMLDNSGQPCDKQGNNLPPGTPPPAQVDPSPSDWAPFKTRIDFETAELLYKKDQMSAGHINDLMELWAASNVAHGRSSPFRNALDMYKTIDRAVLGDVLWDSFKLRYQGVDQGEVDSPSPTWMTAEHTIWFQDPCKVIQNLLANADFMGETNLAPHRNYDRAGQHQYSDFMSGDWAWDQAVRILDICLLTFLINNPGCPHV